jgi:HTH-type transcriptional regulator/antitoxin HipB
LSSFGDGTVLSAYGNIMHRPITSIRDLAATCRGRRLALGLTQAQLATRARVGRPWLSEFERGKPTAELGLVLRLLDALELRLLVEDGSEPLVRRPSEARPIDLDALLDEHRMK